MGQNEGKMGVFARKSGAKNGSNRSPTAEKQRIVRGKGEKNGDFATRKLISPPLPSGGRTEIRFYPHAFLRAGNACTIN